MFHIHKQNPILNILQLYLILYGYILYLMECISFLAEFVQSRINHINVICIFIATHTLLLDIHDLKKLQFWFVSFIFLKHILKSGKNF